MNTSWIRRRVAEQGHAARRIAALAFAALALALVAALPAQAFQKTSFADGSLEYFFAAPSLDIRGSGDLDLTGLSFIEGVEGGFRVGASFDLDWMGGEQAVLASPASTWSGVDGLPRSLSISAAGSVRFDGARLILPGGTISLMADGILNVGNLTVVTAGGSGGVLLIGDPNVTLQPTIPVTGGSAITILPGGHLAIGGLSLGTGSVTSGGTLLLEPGGDIFLTGPIILAVPSPIPEPSTTALLLAGLLGLAGLVSRRANAGR